MTPWTVARQAPLSMGMLQARILEGVAVPFSREASQPRNRTQVSCIAGGFFISCNYTHITSLLILPLLPTPHPFRPPQSARWDSPFYAAASRRLSVLHLIVYMCRCYLLRLSHYVPKSVLYICVSIPSLQTGSSIPLF